VVETYHNELKYQTGKTAAEQKFGKRVKGDHIMANIPVNAVKAMFDRIIKEENI